MSCYWASQLLSLSKIPARASQQIPSFISNVWCILFVSCPRHKSLECCECCHKSGVSAATRRLENLKVIPRTLDTHHSGSSVLQAQEGFLLFSQRKSPIWRQFPALLLHLHHPPALLSLPQFPCAGQKFTLSSAASGAIYSYSGRACSSYYTKELLISNFTPHTSPSRVLSDLTAPGSTREGAGLAGERQERQEEGWRTRMTSPREGFSPLHLAIFHTPPAHGFCRALPEFTSPKLFVLFPASYQKKKKKSCFLLPCNKCLLLARPTLQPSCCG